MIDLPTTEQLKDSCRALPLFPLPKMVLIPNTLLRLHVFEPRYVQLLQDCLRKDRIMVIPQLIPGSSGLGEPPIFSTAGMGYVIHSEEQLDDRYNIVLLGLGIVKITEEVSSDRMYRIARGDLLEDIIPEEKVFEPKLNTLRVLLSQLCIHNRDLSRVLEPLLNSDISAAQFVNTLAHLVHRDPTTRQQFIEESNLMVKAQLVEDALHSILLSGNAIEE